MRKVYRDFVGLKQMPINSNKAELSSCQIKISPEHMKVLKDDLDSKDDRALKEIVAFLIVFGEPLYKSLEKEYKSQNTDILLQCWKVACEIGGAFSEKLKAFGCGGFQSNCLTWNHLIFKYKEGRVRSYINLVDSLLVAYGI
ncbi:MAG: hypothetical protein SCARUB_04346 [Candidatus Scalindua rubra]|uniref:Uncharacterized protein n=1 Tax=Candidatus Scalindua rubra TaxID=1872076 RepID=A0A1E3X4E6_9BACT|nr:MAG: hypothetical protein SCARUB_04346 [Candidatus Scalindua rubra]